MPDLVTLKKALFLLGNVFSLHREIQQSITCFMKLRDVAEEEEDRVTSMNAYRSLGQCYLQTRKYDLARICFKKMLENSWVAGSFEGEMEAYELLSVQYYYLGMLDKSQYYHDRSLHGKSEPKTSPTYQMVMQNYLASQVLEHEKSNFVSKERVRERMFEGKQFVTRTRIKDYSLASPNAVQILQKMRAVRVQPYN